MTINTIWSNFDCESIDKVTILKFYTLLLEKRRRIIPHYRKAFINDTIIFTCESDYDVKWSFNGGPLLPNVKTLPADRGNSFHIIKITGTQLKNSGVYKCVGFYDSISFEDHVVLEVIGKGC